MSGSGWRFAGAVPAPMPLAPPVPAGDAIGVHAGRGRLLTLEQVADELGVDVAWVESRCGVGIGRDLPAIVRMSDLQAVGIYAADLPAWRAAAAERAA